MLNMEKERIMPRYIDADALMKEFSDFVRHSNNSDFAPVPTWNDAVSLVGSAPTIDVPDRKVGEWIWEDSEERWGWSCSNCGYGIRGDRSKTNYCPNCSAKMKGESDAEVH